jgi:membrane protease YdiL (CAAX protease family)
MSQRLLARPAVEGLIAFGLFAVVGAAAGWLFTTLRPAGPVAMVVVALWVNLLLWTPIAVIHYTGRELRNFGITLHRWREGVAWGLVAAAVVLPLFALGYWLVWEVIAGKTLAWRADAVLTRVFFHHLLVVALPEEVFFRGYLQTLFSRAWPSRPHRWWGDQGYAILATSVCFALLHLGWGFSWQRLGVFFPSLVFGWLRQRTGSVVAPILFHTLANVLMFVLEGRT